MMMVVRVVVVVFVANPTVLSAVLCSAAAAAARKEVHARVHACMLCDVLLRVYIITSLSRARARSQSPQPITRSHDDDVAQPDVCVRCTYIRTRSSVCADWQTHARIYRLRCPGRRDRRSRRRRCHRRPSTLFALLCSAEAFALRFAASSLKSHRPRCSTRANARSDSIILRDQDMGSECAKREQLAACRLAAAAAARNSRSRSRSRVRVQMRFVVFVFFLLCLYPARRAAVGLAWSCGGGGGVVRRFIFFVPSSCPCDSSANLYAI